MPEALAWADALGQTDQKAFNENEESARPAGLRCLGVREMAPECLQHDGLVLFITKALLGLGGLFGCDGQRGFGTELQQDRGCIAKRLVCKAKPMAPSGL